MYVCYVGIFNCMANKKKFAFFVIPKIKYLILNNITIAYTQTKNSVKNIISLLTLQLNTLENSFNFAYDYYCYYFSCNIFYLMQNQGQGNQN